jgi:hypothetical protein
VPLYRQLLLVQRKLTRSFPLLMQMAWFRQQRLLNYGIEVSADDKMFLNSSILQYLIL